MKLERETGASLWSQPCISEELMAGLGPSFLTMEELLNSPKDLQKTARVMQERYHAQIFFGRTSHFRKAQAPPCEVRAMALDRRPSSFSSKGTVHLASKSSTRQSSTQKAWALDPCFLWAAVFPSVEHGLWRDTRQFPDSVAYSVIYIGIDVN